jgi:magnesium transporter
MIVSRIIIIINYDKDKKDNNDYELFKNRVKVFQSNVINLKDSLEQTRHGTMQRISYLDSGTTRILTIVASIFLPTSFIISLLSMPFEGVPFKGKKNGYFIVLSIILVIFLILIYLFYEDFANLFRKQ